MSELPAPEEAEQSQQDAPALVGGVSRAPESELRPVERAAGPRPVESKREDIRGALAVTFTVFFGLTLLGGFATAIIGGEAWTNGRDFLQIALPAVTGLLGSAVGFYFGSQRQ